MRDIPVTPTDSPAPLMQRVRGAASVVMGSRGLKDLHQSGSAKAMLPKVYSPVPEVVFLVQFLSMLGCRVRLKVARACHQNILDGTELTCN